MKQVLQFCSILILVLSQLVATAQVDFEGSRFHFNDQTIKSFIPKVFTDMNGDFRDDVMLVEDQDVYQYAYSQSNDSLYLNQSFRQFSDQAWANGAADFDGDGIMELFFTGFYDGLGIYKIVDGQYLLSQQLNTNIFAQAFSVADINSDGHVDLFVCNDNGLSAIFINDGTGILVDDSDMIDMRTTPASDNSGNYGSNWTDIDNDGDPDLYISKCRLGAISSEDPRRINALFINNGDGTFTEQAAVRNVAVGRQTWASDYADVDRDGDLDLFLVNHEAGNQLFYNDGNGVFTEDVSFSELVPNNGAGYQAMAADLDNNGWIDLIVAGTPAIVYYNNEGTFSAISAGQTPFGLFGSAAYGDVNEDGFLDFYAGANTLAEFDNDGDEIYINQGNDNNYITISLQGTTSNRQAIGTKLMMTTSDGTQMRVSSAGTSYSIQNTANQHFGLGQASTVESLEITWPSGLTETYTNLAANTHFVAIEGQCLEVLTEVSTMDEAFLCEAGESLDITATTGDVAWNTGITGQSISADEIGLYQGTVDHGGCITPTNIIKVHEPSERDLPELNIMDDIVLCADDFFTVQVQNYESVTWQDGVMAQSIIIDESTTIQANLETACSLFSSTQFDAEFVDPALTGDIQDEQLAGDVVLETGDIHTKWYADAAGQELIGEGPQLPIFAAEDTTLYFANTPTIQGPSFTVGLDHADVNLMDNTTGQNGLLFINAQRDLIVRSVEVNVVEPGVRELVLVRSNGEEVGRVSVDLQEVGLQRIELNWEMEDGLNYRIMTDEAVNLASFGVSHPQFSLSFNPEFPLDFDSWLTVTNSNFAVAYFYFYNWIVEEPHESCTSPIYAYNLSIGSSNTDDLIVDRSSLNVMPNPASHLVQLELENVEFSQKNRVEVFNSLGKQVYSQDKINNSHQLDVRQWPTGQYIVKLVDGNTLYTSVFTKS